MHELVVSTGLEYPRLSKILFVFNHAGVQAYEFVFKSDLVLRSYYIL